MSWLYQRVFECRSATQRAVIQSQVAAGSGRVRVKQVWLRGFLFKYLLRKDLQLHSRVCTHRISSPWSLRRVFTCMPSAHSLWLTVHANGYIGANQDPIQNAAPDKASWIDSTWIRAWLSRRIVRPTMIYCVTWHPWSWASVVLLLTISQPTAAKQSRVSSTSVKIADSVFCLPNPPSEYVVRLQRYQNICM